MPRKPTLTKKNAPEVMKRLAERMKEEGGGGPVTEALTETLASIVQTKGEVGTVVQVRLSQMLDELLADDVFGTEGQSDPRGDHRDTDEP